MPVFHMLPDEAKTIADYLSTVSRRRAGAYDASFTPAEAARPGALSPARLCRVPPARTDGRVCRTRALDDRPAAEARMDRGLADGADRYKPGTLQPDYGFSGADARALTAYLSSLGRSGSRMRAREARDDTPRLAMSVVRRACASRADGAAPAARRPSAPRPTRCSTRFAPRNAAADLLTYTESQGKHLFDALLRDVPWRRRAGDGQNASNLTPAAARHDRARRTRPTRPLTQQASSPRGVPRWQSPLSPSGGAV